MATRGDRTGLARWLLIAAGSVSVALGIVGAFLPLLPTTPFLLLAAACYARSSKRLYAWLHGNRFFGRYLSDYRDGRGVPLKVKVATLLLLWVTIGCSAFLAVDATWVRIVLALVAVCVTLHIWCIKTRR